MASFRAPDRSRAPALGGSDPWREANPDPHSRQMIRGALATRVYDADDRKEGFRLAGRNVNFELMTNREETIMAWTTPTLVEICVGLEINGYLPAEF